MDGVGAAALAVGAAVVDFGAEMVAVGAAAVAGAAAKSLVFSGVTCESNMGIRHPSNLAMLIISFSLSLLLSFFF